MRHLHWQHARTIGVIGLKLLLYGGLSLFMLILAYTTYRHGGGFSEWQAVVVILAMLALIGLLVRIGLESLGETFSRWRNAGD